MKLAKLLQGCYNDMQKYKHFRTKFIIIKIKRLFFFPAKNVRTYAWVLHVEVFKNGGMLLLQRHNYT